MCWVFRSFFFVVSPFHRVVLFIVLRFSLICPPEIHDLRGDIVCSTRLGPEMVFLGIRIEELGDTEVDEFQPGSFVWPVFLLFRFASLCILIFPLFS